MPFVMLRKDIRYKVNMALDQTLPKSNQKLLYILLEKLLIVHCGNYYYTYLLPYVLAYHYKIIYALKNSFYHIFARTA